MYFYGQLADVARRMGWREEERDIRVFFAGGDKISWSWKVFNWASEVNHHRYPLEFEEWWFGVGFPVDCEIIGGVEHWWSSRLMTWLCDPRLRPHDNSDESTVAGGDEGDAE